MKESQSSLSSCTALSVDLADFFFRDFFFFFSSAESSSVLTSSGARVCKKIDAASFTIQGGKDQRKGGNNNLIFDSETDSGRGTVESAVGVAEADNVARFECALGDLLAIENLCIEMRITYLSELEEEDRHSRPSERERQAYTSLRRGVPLREWI